MKFLLEFSKSKSENQKNTNQAVRYKLPHLRNMIVIFKVFQLSCKDPSGNDIDWYMQIKMNNGYKSVYMDTKNRTGFKSTTDANLSTSPPMRTLAQLKNTGYSAMFNDKTCDGVESSNYAHQKGVIAFDEATGTGFYLLHTNPGWPMRPDTTLSYNNTMYAQDFMCINIDKTNLEEIGKVLYTTKPQIYQTSFPSSFLSSTPYLQKALANKTESKSVQTQLTLTSRGGQAFTFFYKNSQANVEIWGELIGATLKANMLVETWLRDTSAVPSCDDTYTVEMIGKVQWGSTQFKETQDHCKWGVDEKATFACLGDINFQNSQRKRGGGVLCIKDEQVASVFYNAIVEMDETMVC